jgi:hypothetical protein
MSADVLHPDLMIVPKAMDDIWRIHDIIERQYPSPVLHVRMQKQKGSHGHSKFSRAKLHNQAKVRMLRVKLKEVSVNRFSQRERRNRLIIQTALIIILGAIVGFFFVDSPLREQILSSLDLFEARGGGHQDIIKYIVAGIAVFVVGGSILLDYSEKLHFLLEIFPKLLGYDIETMVERGHKFNEVPDTYVRRPRLERAVANDLAPGAEPRLIVLSDAPNTGKTTLINFLAVRKLNRKYHSNITYCRGDLQSVERGAGESDDDTRRRLIRHILARIIETADVGGDTGDTITTMQHAVREHFERERKPWLIVIDQVDDPRFAYTDLLPDLYGVRNTVLIIGHNIQIPAEARRHEGSREVVPLKTLHMMPFSHDEALQLLRAEVRKRNKRMRRADTARLDAYLDNASPGALQRLSDYYAASKSAEDLEAFLSTHRQAMQSGALAQAVVGHLDADQQVFIAALGFLQGATVGVKVLRAIGAKIAPDMETDALIQFAVEHRYLAPTWRGNVSSERKRYAVTKLGYDVAKTAISDLGDETERRIGAALIDIFREGGTFTTSLDAQAELHTILGIMNWANRISFLPDHDLLRLTRVLLPTFYAAGAWRTGISWLTEAEAIAADGLLYRSQGDLLGARARLLLAMGHVAAAVADIAAAQKAYQQSSAVALEDLHQGIFSEAEITRALQFDAGQQRWLAHLHISAKLASDAESLARPKLDGMAERVSQLRSAGAQESDDAMLDWRLALDAAQIAIAQSAMAHASGQTRGAEEMWHAAKQLLAGTPRPRGAISPVEAELLAQTFRLQGVIYRQQAGAKAPLGRWLQRRLGNRAFIRSLGYARRGAPQIEEALTLYESALLALEQAPMLTSTVQVPQTTKRRLPPLSPRWGRLQSARRQLLRANAQCARWHAQATQFYVMLALARVSLCLAAIAPDHQLITEAREYARGAQTIADELEAQLPALKTALKQFPLSQGY